MKQNTFYLLAIVGILQASSCAKDATSDVPDTPGSQFGTGWDKQEDYT